tara:strand:+ start:2358 stop:3551 length:1194 start_codon:yes stop_codon:yes gene_type:complete
MRILKFFGVFLITAIIIFGFVIGWNWKTFTVFLDNREALLEGNEWIIKTSSLKGLSEYMGENPDHSSVASVTISQPDSLIFYQETSGRTQGTTANFFILLAYAIEMDRGNISADEQIHWDQIDQYQLPGVDESVHQGTYQTATERGLITNQSISVENSLILLSQFNDLALADYLWWKLNPDIWDFIKTELNLLRTDMPLPFSGLYLAISPDIQSMSYDNISDFYSENPKTVWRDHVIHQSERFAASGTDRDQILDYMDRNRLGITFMQERDAMAFFPKTTPEEMTNTLQKLIQQELINKNVSDMVLKFMRWPMKYQSGIDANFTDYGAIYDNRMGLMNGIDFGTSAYTGDTTVQAFYLDMLPIGFWFHASGGHMHQDFMQRLIYDPAMIQQMNTVLE